MARRTVRTSVALAGCLTVALAGCGKSSDSTSGSSKSTPSQQASSQSADSSLAAKVPAAVKADGVITIGTDSTYAPSEFLADDGKTVVGFDVDLFQAVAQKLGLKATFVTSDFSGIIPGVQSGKYEMGVSSFTINKARLQQATMISYFRAGTQWVTTTGNPQHLAVDGACGKKVAVQTGTVQVDDITARSAKCKAAGKGRIGIDQYQKQDQATASVVSGKDDAMLADSPVAAYAVKKTSGKLQLLGGIYDAAPYGYVLPKAETAFADAISSAVNALIADGTYAKVLKNWSVEQGAVTKSQVNPAVG